MNAKHIVCKFGGTSCATSLQILKVASIIRANPARRHIVVSAPGLRGPSDTGVTDLLGRWHKEITGGKLDEASHTQAAITARFEEIATGLHVGDVNVRDETTRMHESLQSGASIDFAKSRGEYLNARLIASHLGFGFVNASAVIHFDSSGKLDTIATYAACSSLLKNPCVIPGYFGRTPSGDIRTFSRGGSDITGSLVAAGLGCWEDTAYENWTDVHGFLMTDPGVVRHPKTIKQMTAEELRNLSFSGAKVFHADAIFPVEDAGIPTYIRNTNDPEGDFTLIAPIEEETEVPPITGIAGRKGFVEFRIAKRGMNSEVGFMRKATYVFERHGVSIEHTPTSIDKLSVIVRADQLKGQVPHIIGELRHICDTESVETIENIALLAVVGRGMNHHIGSAHRVFRRIAEAKINTRMITQGGDETCIILAIDEADMERAVQALYAEFNK